MTLEKKVASTAKAESSSSLLPLCGWGRYPLVQGRISYPDTLSALKQSMEADSTDALLARGMGRSYGDAAISANAKVLLTRKLNRMLSFDPSAGILRCEPGVNYEEIISTFLPRGWFPAVSPGTKFVTMGGALASDIHGKNHHKDGSFANFVRSFNLITASGEIITCSRQENSKLFFATAGGMGLTGFISDLEIALKPVESAYMIVKKISCPNLAQTYKMIEETERDFDYSVSWIDCLASGKDLGRSILILGRHAKKSELSPLLQTKDVGAVTKKGLPVPFDMPSWILNRYSIGAFNSLYYALSGGNGDEKLAFYESFFYPLDFLSNWNRMYGKAGFIQYQCALPLKQSKEALEEILALSSKRGRSSFLAVLKKFAAGHGLLSFPIAGYTLTLDMPVKDGLFEFTKELDELVLKYGGRLYLAKDACLSAETLRKMYPELPNWLNTKHAVDPHNKFSSSLAQRLCLLT